MSGSGKAGAALSPPPPLPRPSPPLMLVRLSLKPQNKLFTRQSFSVVTARKMLVQTTNITKEKKEKLFKKIPKK